MLHRSVTKTISTLLSAAGPLNIHQRSLAIVASRKDQRKVTTPPEVYQKIAQQLRSNPEVPDAATEDHKKAIENARMMMLKSKGGNLSNELSPETTDVEQDSLLEAEPENQALGFIKRLVKDGGDKILKVHKTFVHVDYTRFIEPCGEIKGLTLDDALLQLEWSNKIISLKMKEALTDAILKASESGYDLEKTYIAEAYIKNSAHGLSSRFMSKYLRGRGRYGATPNPKTARLELILQERREGFVSREKADPLEWLRIRLRNVKKPMAKSAKEIATSAKLSPKTIFQ